MDGPMGTGQPDLDTSLPVCQDLDTARTLLQQYRAVHIRGMALRAPAEFGNLVESLIGEGTLIPYKDKVSPRSLLAENVYTSTDFSPDANIYFHNENCAKYSWPLFISFFCRKKPESGGDTTLSDIRKVTEMIPDEMRHAFEDRGILYIRNLGGVAGNSLEANFETTDKDKIEAFCKTANIETKWLGDDHLQLRYLRGATQEHPVTGETLWFNNIVFWNPVSLDRILRRALAMRPKDQLPFDTFFGDGAPIPDEWLAKLVEIYKAAKVPFEWEDDGLLLVDNMLFAHGRDRFRGTREIWATMGIEIHRPAWHGPAH